MSQPVQPIEGETTLLQRHVWIKRRAEARYHCGPATAGRVVKEGDGQSKRVWILNLSVRGVGLLLDEALQADTPIAVHIKSPTKGTWFELPARVVHATAQASGEWLIGCEFAEKLDQERLEALL
jgi:hypothetical protein